MVNLDWTKKTDDEDDVLADDFNNLVASIGDELDNLDKNKLTKTEAKNTYTPFPMWESGKRYNYGDIVWHCSEGYNNPFGMVSEGYQLYQCKTTNSVPNDMVDLETPPSSDAANWDYLQFNSANMSKCAKYNTNDSLLLAQDNVLDDFWGIKIEYGRLSVAPASESDIENRTGSPRPITPAHLDYAVRSVKPEVLVVLKGTVDTIGGGSSIDFDVREMALHCNTITILEGTYKSLTFNLPSGKYGDWIQVDFCSGTTPPALTISSSHGITNHDFTPEPNTMYSLYFDWGLMRADGLSRNGWRFSYAEYPYSEV